MSMSLTVVVGNPPSKKSQAEGQSLYILPHIMEGLDALAAQLELSPLTNFVREDPDLLAEIADELDEETLARQAGAQAEWHEPSPAVAAVEGLLEYLRHANANKLPAEFREAESAFVVRAVLESRSLVEVVCEELAECEAQLRKAVRDGSKFHFDIG